MKYAKHTNDMELKCLSVTKILLAIKRKSIYSIYSFEGIRFYLY